MSELPEAQRTQLTSLIALYVDNMDDGHARVKMEEVRAHLDNTWFAWIGAPRLAGCSTTGFTARSS
jgi:hypothetical protein